MKEIWDNLDFDALPDDVKAALVAADEARRVAEERAERLKIYNERLEHLVKEFQRALFGRKSEKISAGQLELAFEELEIATAEAEKMVGKSRSGHDERDKSKKSAKRNLGHLPKELPRIENVIEPDSLMCPCGCGEMKKIGEDRSERLDIIPAQFRVIVTIRPIYACPKNCDGKPVQAAAPAHLIESALPSEGLIAHILVSKYADYLPLYRQSQIYARSGLDLDRSTLSDWCGKAALHLRPIVECMAHQMKSASHLLMDETPAPILDPGRGKTKTGYFWALARDQRGWGGKDPSCVIFNYAPGRSGQYAEDLLVGFDGILQVDGYPGYNCLTKQKRQGGAPLELALCWAHARRKLHDLIDSSEIAQQGVERIAKLYKIEARIRGLSADERLAERQHYSAPIVEEFGEWLTQQRARVSRKSRLGEKLTYIANHWDGLQVFLNDGHVEIDNNLVENPIRSIALARKNSLFAGHDEGGRNWGLIASLIGTCKLNGIEPYDYLKTTLERIANNHPQSRIEELLPWANKYQPYA